ncbi:coproporphyrinogen III oxidase family protein [Geobacter sp. SVR]|uniref:coproporphyrinogen III oxidase family protein n=1 Tax=Geobacter sp. SVR TaxID=2495594 RepID=UPI00143EFD2A|nr:coproporphyrinogen III oxidase family protein [Geobacter sp. SVR]BCS52492.1 coproporphyrinogen III oxidase [Geobacter sp. SVR]GCF84071.1 coproporphyrinogen III oxidase [Geobacter sp. SVR]
MDDLILLHPPSTPNVDLSADTGSIEWDYSAKLVRQVMKRAVKHYLRFSDDYTITSLPKPLVGRQYMLYLHIPFCITLCPYCSFHRFRFHEETAVNYFKLLRREMRMAADLGYRFTSVCFGGGTTTIIPKELAKTIDLAKELFGADEVSVETDPNHIDPENLEHTVGRVNRLSVGIQTFNDTYLERIGRRLKFGSGDEQYAKVEEILKLFPVVNVDMMFNFPGQTPNELAEDIATVRKLNPRQVTCYPLMYAPFAGHTFGRKFGKAGYDSEAAHYRLITQMMGSPYVQRTSWAFAHSTGTNIDEYVVDHEEYVGLGSGAFSFLNGTLYANSFSLKQYGDRVSAGMTSATKSVTFGQYAIHQYRMMVEMFGLRGCPSHKPFMEYNALRLLGAVEGKGRNAVITPKGRFLLSVMLKCFYNGMDYIRESMRRGLTTADERIIRMQALSAE